MNNGHGQAVTGTFATTDPPTNKKLEKKKKGRIEMNKTGDNICCQDKPTHTHTHALRERGTLIPNYIPTILSHFYSVVSE